MSFRAYSSAFSGNEKINNKRRRTLQHLDVSRTRRTQREPTVRTPAGTPPLATSDQDQRGIRTQKLSGPYTSTPRERGCPESDRWRPGKDKPRSRHSSVEEIHNSRVGQTSDRYWPTYGPRSLASSPIDSNIENCRSFVDSYRPPSSLRSSISDPDEPVRTRTPPRLRKQPTQPAHHSLIKETSWQILIREAEKAQAFESCRRPSTPVRPGPLGSCDDSRDHIAVPLGISSTPDGTRKPSEQTVRRSPNNADDMVKTETAGHEEDPSQPAFGGRKQVLITPASDNSFTTSHVLEHDQRIVLAHMRSGNGVDVIPAPPPQTLIIDSRPLGSKRFKEQFMKHIVRAPRVLPLLQANEPLPKYNTTTLPSPLWKHDHSEAWVKPPGPKSVQSIESSSRHDHARSLPPISDHSKAQSQHQNVLSSSHTSVSSPSYSGSTARVS